MISSAKLGSCSGALELSISRSLRNRESSRCSLQFSPSACTEVKTYGDSPFDWPAFVPELVSFRLLRDGFTVFSISRIPKTRNLRADVLAKEARNSDTLFSHIDQTQPDRTFLWNDSNSTTT
ncbi:hypothetical protein N665_1515s0014 [Sinapis alba]|nr:hypothetical protein N665_1515s0014 [Sinapis alba]